MNTIDAIDFMQDQKHKAKLRALGFIAAAAFTVPAFADNYQVWFEDLVGGTGCTFPLRVEQDDTANRVTKTFYDRNGNLVRYLDAGKGANTRFTNLATGASVIYKGNGSVMTVKPQADGSTLYKMTGHSIMILFPTDVPKGPSTTIYVGQMNFTIDSSNSFTTMLPSPGRKIDICAELTP